MFSAVWNFRQFIRATIKGELKGRFARSNLGALWFILHPLAQATIFALVLSEVLGAKLPNHTSSSAYAIYLMAGMAAWGLFSEIVIRCCNIFIDYAGSLKKIAFPRLCLPVVVVGTALINHFLLLAAIVVVFLFFGHVPGLAWLAIPIGIVCICALGVGIGLILGVFNVFSRDVGQVLSVVMQIWFWVTPVVYPANVIPAKFKWFVDLNPMVNVVAIYQNALLNNTWPNFDKLAVPAIAGIVLMMFAYFLFRRASPELVDVL
jgi:lipopolysaccharide transport system permease protein